MAGDVESQTRENHYVAQWYQRRFLCGGSKLHYLDMKPEVRREGAHKWSRRALRKLGPASCFFHNDLYTLKLGGLSTDQIERKFFGPIDAYGKSAVEFFSQYDVIDGVHEAFQAIVSFMDAQRFRTPRALEWLSRRVRNSDRNVVLHVMGQAFQYHATMWTEASWEVVSAKQCATKFLLTDNPVTFYNSRAFPNGPVCIYPNDIDLGAMGTRTIFPLGMNECLILTHTDFVRDPSRSSLAPRTNARAYQPTTMSLMDVQIGRELHEDEVLRINYILKMRADRYIAASDEQWLYPERHISRTHWSKLDDDWFLLPNLYEVKFTSGIVVGYKDGRSFAIDEYGRRPAHPKYQDKSQHADDWQRHLDSRVMWSVKRDGKTKGRSWEHKDRAVFDSLIADDVVRFRTDPEVRKRLRRFR